MQQREAELHVAAVGTPHAASAQASVAAACSSQQLHEAGAGRAPVVHRLLLRHESELQRRRRVPRPRVQEDVALEPAAAVAIAPVTPAAPAAVAPREAEHRAAATMKRRHRRDDDDQEEEQDAAADDAVRAKVRREAPASDDEQAAGSDRRVDEGAVLRCLTDAPALVKRVRQLNLGVLPVQCPEFCYKRAARDLHELSWAVAAPGDAAAVAGGLVAEFEPLNRAVHVRTLAVAPRFRRRGLARRLVAKLVQQTRRLRAQVGARQLDSVRLHVHVGNADALAFYARMGFRPEARLEGYYRHLEPRACLVMRLALDDGADGEGDADEDGGDESKQASE